MIIRCGQASWRHLTRVFCTSSHTHRYTARTHKPWPSQAISAVAITHDRRQETGNIATTSLSNFKRCTLFATCNICAVKFFRFSAADNKTVHCAATGEKPAAAAVRIQCACVCCTLCLQRASLCPLSSAGNINFSYEYSITAARRRS